MKFNISDDVLYPASIKEAMSIQNRLRTQVSLLKESATIKLIAGIDVGYDITTERAKAALVTMFIDELEPVESLIAFEPVTFPYVPGYLSFRETPAIIKALSLLKEVPDLLMIDGQGVAHPRRLGIAAHIGVLTGIPTIGVAKSRLCGVYIEPGLLKGEQSDLVDHNERIGTVFRSRNKVKPLFISPGHKMDFDGAVDIVEKCLTRYRLPEPTRLADKLSKVTQSEKIFDLGQ